MGSPPRLTRTSVQPLLPKPYQPLSPQYGGYLAREDFPGKPSVEDVGGGLFRIWKPSLITRGIQILAPHVED